MRDYVVVVLVLLMIICAAVAFALTVLFNLAFAVLGLAVKATIEWGAVVFLVTYTVFTLVELIVGVYSYGRLMCLMLTCSVVALVLNRIAMSHGITDPDPNFVTDSVGLVGWVLPGTLTLISYSGLFRDLISGGYTTYNLVEYFATIRDKTSYRVFLFITWFYWGLWFGAVTAPAPTG